MTKPDQKAAIKKINDLHMKLCGVLMCMNPNDIAYTLSLNVRAELRQIIRLLGEEDCDD